MEGGALLSQGGYGCVFSPSINCNGKESSKKFISKIQKNDFSADNEILVGNIVSKHKDYRQYFAPVINTCSVNVSKIQTQGLGECNIMTENANLDLFLMMKIRFIEGSVLSTFITENKNSALIFSSFINIYTHLLKSIDILIQQKVVHFDLKGANIVYDKNTETPIVIDFGLSIPMNILLDDEEYYRYFYIYAPDYYVWPLEVHFLNFIENIDPEPTKENIKNLVDEFVENNSAINKLSPSFQKKYKISAIEELSKYLNQPQKQVKEKILTYWDTWDNYSISIMYLKYIDLLFGNDVQIEENQFIKFMIKTMLQNIHPDPNKRISVKKNIELVEKIISESDSMVDFEDLIKEISINKVDIIKKTLKNKKTMEKLTKKILSKK
jgi:serine/threonine protein kinase